MRGAAGPSDEGRSAKRRLAMVVSHPIQYYAPLYQRLALRTDLSLRVFFTWHAADKAVLDRGFGSVFAWDVPLTAGYESELVPNSASDPGTHRFGGLRNPSLFQRVIGWSPDVVHVTGWAWRSHFAILRQLHARGIPILFRGDSHLLDSPGRGIRWWVKRALLTRVFSWPSEFLYVGGANRRYYEAFRVEASRLRYCPHSIDVGRFAAPAGVFEQEAAEWRRALGIPAKSQVVLYAGKFESKKQPLELMTAALADTNSRRVWVFVGGGPLETDLRELAAAAPSRILILPFQNQSQMPVVYRLGDLFILPSAHGETWGLAVNEALACGRPVVVSDRVGCAGDVVDASCGEIVPWNEWGAIMRAVNRMFAEQGRLAVLALGASKCAWNFDLSKTESSLVESIFGLGHER